MSSRRQLFIIFALTSLATLFYQTMMTPPAIRNVIVAGGSYVGLGTARQLMEIVPANYRVLLIEPHKDFHHIFTFPRFAILPGHEQKAFVPYSGVFNGTHRHNLVTARVTNVHPNSVDIDTEWEGSKSIPFEYLVLATGTRLAAPSMMTTNDKESSTLYLRSYQESLRKANSITLVGGGAVGVQMAIDLKELYPNKDLVLVQSRDRVMPQFHEGLHNLVKNIFDDLGIKLITGTRAIVPSTGFPNNGQPFSVSLTNGQSLSTEFVIPATGQSPNTALIKSLPASSSEGLVNPVSKFLRVKKTLQLQDEKYPHIFAVGDVADSGAQKAARPGSQQAGVVARNIVALMHSKEELEEYEPGAGAIHLSLGMKRNVIFRNPNLKENQTEPTIIDKYDGQDDLGAQSMWQRLNVTYRDGTRI